MNSLAPLPQIIMEPIVRSALLSFTTHLTAAGSVSSALADTNWQVRAAAAESLGRIGHVLAIEALATALSDELWQVRQKSLGALGS
ncbi:HEAT repeat domain-containing protein [Bradyrhizobium sp. Arg314]